LQNEYRRGEVLFTKEDCCEQISISQEFSMMDYSSSLEECMLQITVKLLTINNIEFILNNFEKDRDIWESRSFYTSNFIEKIKTAENNLYKEFAVDFDERCLLNNSILTIELLKGTQ